MNNPANPMVEITVRDFGTIKLRLDSTQAPISAANFVRLAEEGFYTGLKFHRIIKGFMIQGGDGKPEGKSAATIKGEFSANGVSNTISHTRGTISMARTNVMDSASSQFFICDADSTFLDGQYAAFGHVVDGIDVVDRIAKTPAYDGNGSIREELQPIIETIRICKS